MPKKARSMKKRREIFDDFDAIELSAAAYLYDRWKEPYYHIEKADQGYLVQYRLGYKWNAESKWNAENIEIPFSIALEGDDAARLRSALDRLPAYQWTKEFHPKDVMVCDGCYWEMNFRKGDDYFQAYGDNAAPQELIDFYEYVVSLGLPRLDECDEIADSDWEATDESPFDILKEMNDGR